ITYYHELDDTLYTVTSGTFVGEIYALFGLENVADPADADGSAFGYPQLSAEYLVDADPDLIFLADTKCCGQSAATVAARPGWDTLTAVREGHVVELDDDIASRWGPRVVDFARAVAAALDTLAVPAG
ncbi:MAG: ABC transporter substrate-binding protein, partial [Actinomyces sp.]